MEGVLHSVKVEEVLVLKFEALLVHLNLRDINGSLNERLIIDLELVHLLSLDADVFR
jgi:hypothetical protein